MIFTTIFIPFKITINVLGSPIFFRNVPFSIRRVGGRKKLKLSLIKTSLFMVGVQGSTERGPKSYFPQVKKMVIQDLDP